MFNLDISSGAKPRLRINKTDLTSALWVSFWLFIATKGDPDIVDMVVRILEKWT